MGSSLATNIPVTVALVGLAGVLWTTYRTNRNDQERHAREVLLRPAEDFARCALDALARLRYITPPFLRPTEEPPHRNECLLDDPKERKTRLDACAESIDKLRVTRGDVRLVFRPDSNAAELAAHVLGHLRDCLESAETFYISFDRAHAQQDQWRQSALGTKLRDNYMDHRRQVYQSLDEFFAEVSTRLMSPSWRTRGN